MVIILSVYVEYFINTDAVLPASWSNPAHRWHGTGMLSFVQSCCRCPTSPQLWHLQETSSAKYRESPRPPRLPDWRLRTRNRCTRSGRPPQSSPCKVSMQRATGSSTRSSSYNFISPSSVVDLFGSDESDSSKSTCTVADPLGRPDFLSTPNTTVLKVYPYLAPNDCIYISNMHNNKK